MQVLSPSEMALFSLSWFLHLHHFRYKIMVAGLKLAMLLNSPVQDLSYLGDTPSRFVSSISHIHFHSHFHFPLLLSTEVSNAPEFPCPRLVILGLATYLLSFLGYFLIICIINFTYPLSLFTFTAIFTSTFHFYFHLKLAMLLNSPVQDLSFLG